MKNVASLLALAGAAQADLPVSEQYALMAQGFITSALHYEHMDDYVACGVTDPIKEFGVIKQGIDEVGHLNIHDAFNGVKDIRSGFKGIMTDYQTCVSDTKDAATLAKVEAYLKSFPDIKSFNAHISKDIFWNSVSIGKETYAMK